MDMAESYVVSALANKRAEIAGPMARTQQRLGQFRADLVHLDDHPSVSPAMEPQTIPAKRIRHADPWFERGELSRRVLRVLLVAGSQSGRIQGLSQVLGSSATATAIAHLGSGPR